MTRIVVVTGMSGAGRSTVLRVLEDLGWDAVDNLPAMLLRPLLDTNDTLPAPLALGIDSRSRGLAPAELVQRIAQRRERRIVPISLLFMDCDDEILRRRYSETRRRHPMAADRPVSDGIARERLFMAPLRGAADYVFDSSATKVGDLRRWVEGVFARGSEPALTITLVSFAFRHGLPREADLVFDMRFLRNPHYEDELRPLTGLDRPVQAYIEADPDYAPALERLSGFILPLLPRYAAEGKSYLTIAIGCTGGQHRSVFTTEALNARLHEHGWPTSVIHRDLPLGSSRPQPPGP